MRKEIRIFSMPLNIYLKKAKVLFLIIIGITLCSACGSQRVWMYHTETKILSAPISNNSVAVPPFMDERINENKNRIAFYAIPLFPFGWQTMYTPEGVQMHTNSGLWLFEPNEDFAQAVATELENSSIFKEVFFTNRASEGELSLIGTIKSTKYSGKIYSYGLSVYGPLLWLFGLPATSTSNDLVLNLKLQDNKTKNILWEANYSKSIGKTSWIYYLKADFNYDKMLKEIMKEAIPSLKQKLSRD